MRPLLAEQRPMMPIIASLPLLISARSLVCFCSSVSFLVKPAGSKRSRGTGWGKMSSLIDGKKPGLPPRM